MVAAGLTDWLPPLVPRGYELPSLPLRVTFVALVAVTVIVEDPPEAMEVGFAEMLTVGDEAMDTVAVAVALPPVPLAVAV